MDSPYFALGSGCLIAITGTVMAMHPEYRTFGWLFIALMLALFVYMLGRWLLPVNGWPANDDAARKTILTAGAVIGLLVGVCAMFAFDPPWTGRPPKAQSASLRILFFGDDRTPTAIRYENIAVWYAYFNPSARATYKSTNKGEETTLAIIPKTWAIFVVFDRPTSYREITVGFSSPGLPIYDVRQPTERSVIVSFRSDIPAGELEISTKN